MFLQVAKDFLRSDWRDSILVEMRRSMIMKLSNLGYSDEVIAAALDKDASIIRYHRLQSRRRSQP